MCDQNGQHNPCRVVSSKANPTKYFALWYSYKFASLLSAIFELICIKKSKKLRYKISAYNSAHVYRFRILKNLSKAVKISNKICPSAHLLLHQTLSRSEPFNFG